jgi:hypothetical protein
MLGIPLYADVDTIHDYVVQVRGAFDETVLGLYNLAQNQVPIEIRVVLHAQTEPLERIRADLEWPGERIRTSDILLPKQMLEPAQGSMNDDLSACMSALRARPPDAPAGSQPSWSVQMIMPP